MTRAVELIGLENGERWEAALARFPAPERDVYFGAGYHRAFENPPASRARLYVYARGSELLAYPFLLRRIQAVGGEPVSGDLQDIESAYGFSGPISTTADAGFLDEAWREFAGWAAGERVVAEFVRFNPLLANERLAPAETLVERVREHVVIDLRPPEEQIWRDSYTKVNRNMIRKAERAGVECRVGPPEAAIERFCELYQETMDRNQAGRDYYFTRAHFELLAAGAPLLACTASLAGRVLAISLFLAAPPRLHYHLSGASPEGLRLGANNLILREAVREGRRRGFECLHLGGGRTGAQDDSLLRFKAGFSPERRPVSIGRRVHRQDLYDDLCALRRQQTPAVPAGFFLVYRYEAPGSPRQRTM